MRLILLLLLLASAACLASAGWTVDRANLATVVLGVSCSNDRVCFAGVGQNGVGVQMWATTNWSDWQQIPLDPQTGQMMFMSTASSRNGDAVTIGMGFPASQYGNLRGFSNSEPYAVLTASQNIEPIQGVAGGFGFAGDFVFEDGQGEGVGISMNGGKNFDLHSIPQAALHGWTRYASYPSANRWMVSTGAWPTATGARAGENGVHHVSARLQVDGSFRAQVLGGVHAAGNYRGGITVTTDAGRSWKNVFKVDGIYLNQVKCVTSQTCFVVGEGQGTAVIMRTTNFGSTWSTVFESHAGMDLMAVEAISEREVRACGMRVVDNDLVGVFLHSVDGGASWRQEELDGFFCVDMSFPKPGLGKAAAIDRSGNSHMLKFTA